MTILRTLIQFFMRHWLATALLTSIAMLAIAQAFQVFGGLEPCHLCMQQRYVYRAAIGVALVGLVLGRTRVGPRYDFLFGCVLAVVFLVGMGIAIEHAGGEWKWWRLPETCTGGRAVTAEDMQRLLNGAKFSEPRCDVAAWRFLGLSMAGWNVLISLKLAFWSAVFAYQRWKRAT